MPTKFGTSGLRGLITELTHNLVWGLRSRLCCGLPDGTGLFVARDLRPSSPAIARMLINAACA
jgi:phosphomannomutase